ncbi:MAG: hypothetical protein KGL39_00595 [Patescibacteria group bacterium]|nr:hypothetical protein [Patescibacteria group bacterium]
MENGSIGGKMSLAGAINDIANGIDEDVQTLVQDDEVNLPVLVKQLRGYAKQLRFAVKASEGVSPLPLVSQPEVPAFINHRLQIEKAKEEFRKDPSQIKRITDLEESIEPRLLELVGGASNGDHATVPGNMPIGARTQVNGQVYKLHKDGKGYFDEKETFRLADLMKDQQASDAVNKPKIFLGS